MARETGVQYDVDSYQRLKNGIWCLLAQHNIIEYTSRVSRVIQKKE